MMKNALFYIIIFFLFSKTCLALAPEAHLKDENQESRAMEMFLEVRCLVCEGQVIESSNTEFSFEMRKLIRQKISDGDSNQKIKNDLIKEFGEDILISNNFSKNNFLLWLLPIAFSLYGFHKIYLLKKTSQYT